MHTRDITDDNIEKIAQLFPSCVTETISDNGVVHRAIDFEALKRQLSDETIPEGRERYIFTWPGKSEAQRLANSLINKTLRPCRDRSVDFDNTQNVYIEGDNLDVLKLLRETYLGKIRMIYIDPPYNTGNDFVYYDNYSTSDEDYSNISGEFDELNNRLVINNGSNGKYHTDWLNMLYPRLIVSRDLLSDNGVILISIDDCEITNLRKICDEVFGEKNFVAQFVWKKKQGGGNDSSYVVIEHEYILCYSKNINKLSLGLDKKYKLDDSLYPYKDEKGEYGLITLDKASIQFSQSLVFEIKDPQGNTYLPRIVKGKQSCWRWSKAKVESQYDELVFKNGKVYTKYYRPEGVTPRSLLIDAIYGRTESGNDDIKALFNSNPFSYPKPLALIEHFISICSDKDSIIMDYFSGSATTAQAVFNCNNEDNGHRKFILVQLPERIPDGSIAKKEGYDTICDIGIERIRRSGLRINSPQKSLINDDKDVGFRVFRSDSSNMNDIFYDPQSTSKDILDYAADNIKSDRSGEDLLIQVMLELGIELSAKIITEKISGKDVFIVDEGYLIACFDEDVDDDLVTDVAKRQPYYAVFRDSSMSSDAVAINFGEIFKTYSPNTKTRVL